MNSKTKLKIILKQEVKIISNIFLKELIKESKTFIFKIIITEESIKLIQDYNNKKIFYGLINILVAMFIMIIY